MSWQVVWSVKEEGGVGVKEEGQVEGLVWRPDGKVLAVSYQGLMNLYNVEGGALIHSSLSQDPVAAWCSVPITTTSHHMAPTQTYLPPLEDIKTDIQTTRELLETRKDLNVMLLSDREHSCVKLAAQGVLLVSEVAVPGIVTVGLTSHATELCVISNSQGSTVCTVYNTHSLAEHVDNVNDVAIIYSKVLTLSEYLLSTFKAMTDCWDDVLSEFNKKLFSFHMSLHPSNLSEQFLHLLVTGMASIELENFLVNTLKEKEISKLLQSTLQSYQGIEKLITRNFMGCCYALATELQTLLGMSRWYDRYEELGLKEEAVQNSIDKLAGLMIKSQELLQCISNSKAKLGAFLKWLVKATMSLGDGNSSSVKLSDSEMNLVVEFLKTGNLFASRADTTHFKIDTVWQYFSQDDIIVPPDYFNNKILDDVIKLLKDEKPHLTVQPSISLVKSHKLFSDSLLECFDLNLPNLNTPLHSITLTPLYSLSSDAKTIRFVDEHNIITMVTVSREGLHLSNQSRHIVPDKIVDIFGYDRDFILVTKDGEGCHSVCICFEDDIVRNELGEGYEKIFVSESRRLGAIVSSHGRRIQVLDLDEDNNTGEEEDEDDES